LAEDKSLATIVVHVQPNARQNQLVRFEGGVWHLRIAAPPVKGRANQALLEFLSETLGIGKTRLIIQRGMAAKKKVIVIAGLTREEIMERLAKSMTEQGR
jgi:uncharacterized protein (TIGR00251 family)